MALFMLEQKRADFVEQLDRLVIALSVYSYFCDPSFFILLVRVIVQIQLTNPALTTPTRSLPNLTNYLILLNLGIYLRHFLYGPSATFGSQPRGIFLNFVGQTTPTTLLQVLLQSTFIFVLQLICLLVAYETTHNPPSPTATSPTTLSPLPASTSPSSTAPPVDSPGSTTSTILDDLEAGGSFESSSDTLLSSEYVDFLSPSPPSSSHKRRRPSITPSSHLEAYTPASTTATAATSSFSFASSSAMSNIYLTPEPPEEDTDHPILELEPFSSASRLTGIGPYARKGNPASQNERDQRMIRRRRDKESERIGRKRRWRWR